MTPMTPMSKPEHLRSARQVADAILYEGYLLYPYHQAAQKNQARFQFGVLMPPVFEAVDPSERSAFQAECLVECGDEAAVVVDVRFLHLQHRRVLRADSCGDTDRAAMTEVSELLVGDSEYTAWDEAIEREHRVHRTVAEILGREVEEIARFGAGQTAQDITDSTGTLAGMLLREWDDLRIAVRLGARRVAGPFGALRLSVCVENLSVLATTPRDRGEALASALLAAHALIQVPGGTFVSMTDPPEWAAAEVAACQNTGIWPVLAGPPECRDLMLAAPVILADHAEVAPESAGDLFDATEIDEILTLRTLALTEDEKRAARATDPRAAELFDRLEVLPPEMLDRLHGAIRYLGPAPEGAPGRDRGARAEAAAGTGPDRVPSYGDPFGAEPDVPWWDPGSDSSVSPETDHVVVDGVAVARGSRVRMRPGARRADAQDLFLAGREARVEAVLFDVDQKVHLALTVLDDPAADLNREQGRFLYFGIDEIEPLSEVRSSIHDGVETSEREEGSA